MEAANIPMPSTRGYLRRRLQIRERQRVELTDTRRRGFTPGVSEEQAGGTR